MGLIQSLKDIYYSLEDGYYGLLDRINKVVPVYRAIDPIDRMIPSFLLVLLAVLLVGVWGISALSGGLPNLFQENITIPFEVKDASGQALAKVKVDYRFADKSLSTETDAQGAFSITVPLDSEVELLIKSQVINGKKFDALQKKIVASAREKQTLTLQSPSIEIGPQTKTIIFKAPTGERIAKKGTTVKLSCREGTIPIELLSDEDGDGIIIVENAAQCIGMSATVVALGFTEQTFQLPQPTNSITLTPSTGSIPGTGASCGDGVCQSNENTEVCAEDCSGQQPEPREGPAGATGKIRVIVQDEQANSVTAASFNVSLKDNDGSAIESKQTEYYGQVSFKNLAPKKYAVTVSDENALYSSYTQAGIQVNPAGETLVTATVSRNVRARLSVQVVEKGTNNAIANADVEVRNSSGVAIEKGNTGSEAKTLSFAFFDPQQSLIVYAIQDDYFYAQTGIASLSGEQSLKIELEKVTPENSGKIRVQVVDESGQAVEGAKVKLLFGEGSAAGSLTPYAVQSTDANGTAGWQGIREEVLYPSAEKWPAYTAARELAKKIAKKELNEFKVTLAVGDADVSVEARSEQNELLQNSQAEFFDMAGQSIARYDMPQGTLSQKIRAGRKVFAVITSPNHVKAQTIPKMLWPDTLAEFKAELPLQGSISQPSVSFEGMLENYSEAQAMESGKRYLALFKFKLPSAVQQAGIHFRTGDTNTVSGDALYIGEIDAGNAKIEKGSAFNPPLGSDAENLLESSASVGKWADAKFSTTEPEVVYAAFEVVVKKSTAPMTPLPMHYRAWTASGDTYSRMPADAGLGSARETAAKKELFAQTFEINEFLEGVPVTCGQDFCYAGEDVLDEQSNLFLDDKPYALTVFGPYLLNFVIKNNSDAQFNGIQLIIASVDSHGADNESILIRKYSLLDADSHENANANFNAFKSPAIPLGGFSKGKSVLAKLWIEGKKLESSGLEARIVSGGQTVYRKKIEFKTASKEDMALAVEPSAVNAFEQKDILVTVKDSSGKPLSGVLVKAKKILADASESWLACVSGNNCMSSDNGEVIVHVPASSPLTQIVFGAEKIGYWLDKPLALTVSGQILSFEPEKLQSRLDTRAKTNETISTILTATSHIGETLKLTKSDYKEKSSRFFGVLDYTAMLSFLQTKTNGLEIKPLQAKELADIIKTQLVSAGIVDRQESLDGWVWLTFQNQAFAKTYDVFIPLNVAIGFGETPADKCVSVDNFEWNDSTDAGKTGPHISNISNNCQFEGAPIALDGLQFTYHPAPYQGDVSVSLKTIDGTPIGTYALTPDVPVDVQAKINSGESLVASFVFTAKPGAQNETTAVKIEVKGLLKKQSGFDEVQGVRDVEGTISIIDLSTCIAYTPEDGKLELQDNPDTVFFDPEGELSISTEKCPSLNKDVRIKLCYNDSHCAGGTEGGLSLDEEDFLLTPSQKSKTIKVTNNSDISGIYGINVYGNLAGNAPRKLRKDDVLVTSPPDRPKASEPFGGKDYFELLRYDFKVFPSLQDKTTVVNSAYQEVVHVKADGCVWENVANSERDNVKQYIKTATLMYVAYSTYKFLNAALPMLGSLVKIATLSAKVASIRGEIDAIGGTGQEASGDLYGKLEQTQAKLHSAQGQLSQLGNLAASFGISLVASWITNMVVNWLADQMYSCHDVSAVNPMNDYVLNISGMTVVTKDGNKMVPPDSTDDQLKVSGLDGKIRPKWNLEEGRGGDVEMQEIVFSNDGYQADTPKFAILEVGATEHINGDALHDSSKGRTGSGDQSYDVICSSGTVDQFNIGNGPDEGACSGTSERHYSQKFHIRVQTKEVQEWEPIRADVASAACEGRGVTGEKALPKINLNWKWSTDGTNNINAWSCDADNPDGIYCDATQFSIALTQRMQFLRDFLNANPSFACPTDPEYALKKAYAEQNTSNGNQSESQSGKVYFKKILLEKDAANENHFTFKVQVENLSDADRTAKVVLSANGLPQNSFTKSLAGQESSIARGTTKEFVFDAGELPKNIDPYSVVAGFDSAFIQGLSGTEAQKYATKAISVIFWNIARENASQCWLNNTTFDIAPGVTGLEAFYDRELPFFGQLVSQDQGEPHWTKDVPDKETLHRILRPRVNLIRDGYSDDFQKDFAQFYSNKTFYNTPSYFDSDATGRFADYFNDTSKLDFRYTPDSDVLPDAGVYDAELRVVFGNDWKFFGSDGKPKAQATVKFSYADYPNPASMFYYLPFDGQIGIGTDNGRQGYGLNYLNQGAPVKISTEAGQNIVEAKPVENSNALQTLATKIETDAAKINGAADTRGALLSIARQGTGNEKLLTFSPNYATPVVMKMNVAGQKNDRFSAYYQLFENDSPKVVGSVLGYWSGLSACRDFTGDYSTNAFRLRPDRRGQTADPVSGAQNAYAIDWLNAVKTGDVFLKTILYAPAQSNFVLKSLSPAEGKLSFNTMDGEHSTSVHLGGLGRMQKNSKSNNDTVSELNDVFGLVKDGQVCLTDSGDKSVFFWNPLTVYSKQGSGGTSLDDFEATLVAGQTCIG